MVIIISYESQKQKSVYMFIDSLCTIIFLALCFRYV